MAQAVKNATIAVTAIGRIRDIGLSDPAIVDSLDIGLKSDAEQIFVLIWCVVLVRRKATQQPLEDVMTVSISVTRWLPALRLIALITETLQPT